EWDICAGNRVPTFEEWDICAGNRVPTFEEWDICAGNRVPKGGRRRRTAAGHEGDVIKGSAR
ncbi:MAG: hypothetical protein RL885_21490, partial [Planctomycetota bacterium]